MLASETEETTCIKDVGVGIYRWIHVLAGKGDESAFRKDGAVGENGFAGDDAA